MSIASGARSPPATRHKCTISATRVAWLIVFTRTARAWPYGARWIRSFSALKKPIHEKGRFIAERPVAKANTNGETKYYFTGLPAKTSLKELATAVRSRWPVEQFYEDAKQPCGLGDFRGRRWDGLHRHVAPADAPPQLPRAYASASEIVFSRAHPSGSASPGSVSIPDRLGAAMGADAPAGAAQAVRSSS